MSTMMAHLELIVKRSLILLKFTKPWSKEISKYYLVIDSLQYLDEW